jgi:hypothetical protein
MRGAILSRLSGWGPRAAAVVSKPGTIATQLLLTALHLGT